VYKQPVKTSREIEMNKDSASLAGRRISRRSILKGGAAIAASTTVTGFPTVWAQNLKDVTLNHTGMSYSTLADIAKQATKDLGFKVDMSVVDHPGLTNRMVNDPKSIDIADMEIWQSKIMIPQGVTQAVEIAKIKNWGDLTPLYTEGVFAGKEVSRQGDSPIKYMYRDSKDARPSSRDRRAGPASSPESTMPIRWASGRTSSAVRSPPGPT
jgi:putative spermidine/putrescine transport system substrate-binding protein